MNIVHPSVVDNGNQPRAQTRRFLQQDSSDKSVTCHRGGVGLSVHEHVLCCSILLVLLLSDRSRPPI